MQRRLLILCAVALFVLPFALAKTGPQCTDRDLDGAAIEGGSCGPIDCNDEDNVLRPGGREVCGDNLDNNCNGRADEGCRCSDTDGGKVFEVRGEACRTSAFGRRTCTVDRCLDDSQVEEFFCKRASKGSFRVQSETHTCENGCSNGECVQMIVQEGDGDPSAECVGDACPTAEPAAPCLDTDGGHNYAVRGTATRTETLVQGQPGFQDMTDFCVRENTGSANPRLLAEAFCTLEGFVFRENFLCPGQCVSGACIAATGGIDVG